MDSLAKDRCRSGREEEDVNIGAVACHNCASKRVGDDSAKPERTGDEVASKHWSGWETRVHWSVKVAGRRDHWRGRDACHSCSSEQLGD
uniref:Uncharacterized protein n=1 Tax=Cucumis melo TaxID=3656 RepID=A0A9I9DTH6_CUCME